MYLYIEDELMGGSVYYTQEPPTQGDFESIVDGGLRIFSNQNGRFCEVHGRLIMGKWVHRFAEVDNGLRIWMHGEESGKEICTMHSEVAGEFAANGDGRLM